MSLLASNSDFAETPLGVFTANGNWFYTNSEQINRFAPGLLNRVGLDELIRKSELWIRSTDALTLLLMAGLIQFAGGYLTALICFVFLWLWHMSKSALISGFMNRLLKIITLDPLVLLACVVSISYLGITERYADLSIALALFMVFRFGWIRKLLDRMYDASSGKIGLNDRVLKMVVVRESLRENIPIRQVQSMEDEILELMRKRKAPKRKR